MNIPVAYGPVVAAVTFAAVSGLANWIDNWRFKREMERLH